MMAIHPKSSIIVEILGIDRETFTQTDL